MASYNETMDYDSVTDTLMATFGSILSREVIYTIVESCSGDLNYAANAIMSITSENDSEWTMGENATNNTVEKDLTKTDTHDQFTAENESSSNNVMQPALYSDTLVVNATQNINTISYAQASTSKNDVVSTQQNHSLPKQHSRNFVNNMWTEKIRYIIKCYNEGIKILIFMRGAPGSGKSHLAKQIVEITVGPHAENLHIFSTDDFFMSKGVYKYNKIWLSDAHYWNQKRARRAIKDGISPVIIDNTNIECWEMKPYAVDAVRSGYVIEIVEPDTPWAKKLSQLKRRNVHNVPERNIQRMLDMLSTPITSTSLLAELNLSYPAGLQPPVMECLPEYKGATSTFQENNDGKFQLSGAEELILQPNVGVVQNVPIEYNPNISYQLDSFSKNKTVQEQRENQVLADQIETLNINKNHNVTPETKPNFPNDIDENSEKEQLENESKCNLDHNQNHTSLEPSEQIDNLDDTLKEIPASLSTEIKETSANLSTETKETATSLSTEINFEKLEEEWDKGEAWEEDTKKSPTLEANINFGAKPPRKNKIQGRGNTIALLHDHDNNWKKISMYMPPWIDKNKSQEPTKSVIETKSAETCIEIGDTDILSGKNRYKIMSAVSRDINFNYTPKSNDKIPKNPMFDKSSMTNEPAAISLASRCKNEDKHFIRFRNMFKNLNKDDLRYIFDKCCGDVNWAVCIVLDDLATKQIKTMSVDEQSDAEEENDEPCECTAHYNIIPDPTTPSDEVNEDIPIAVPSTSNSTNEISNLIKKQKKDSALTDTSMALKRQIEENIVISDHHYSQHCLKVRKLRRGEFSEETDTVSFDIVNTESEIPVNSEAITEDINNDYDTDDDLDFIDIEKTININIGHEFVSQLDSLFGRKDMVYSNNIEPRINMPISLVNEINALWMESLMHQLEAESRIHEEIIKQDEEFARELSKKEEEVKQSGKESEVPNLKEVMDLEYALSLYRKDCNEWQKGRPTDLAAKLSTQKLYNLFPEIAQADLDEIHMAHHYDFQATVGVLLLSSGRGNIVEEENGINKFVMAEELRRQQKVLEEEKVKLKNELDWPELPSQITLDVVNNYRTEAETHLQNRQLNFGKAQDYMLRGMPLVASFYSDVAHLHTLKYEQAQSIAAASLMQFHAERCKNNETLDLHYLRVPEARTALDMFLDSHIQNIRQNSAKKNIVLYFITGRGLHSAGGPKIKPVVKKRLSERRLPCMERNPGLLTTKICAEDKLSYQIT